MYHFYIDGSCKQEKNHTRVGFALTDKGGALIWEGGQDAVMGTKFEEHALVLALQMVEKFKVFPVRIYTDAMSNARYLEKRKEDKNIVKERDLMETAHTILERLGDKVSVEYLPRRFNFLADNQAQKKSRQVFHSIDYIQDSIKKWKEGKKTRLHFFAENDVYLTQKSVFNEDFKTAWKTYQTQNKVIHEHVLAFIYDDQHKVVPQAFIFNRTTQEKTDLTLTLKKPIYNRNTALSYLLEQSFDILAQKGIEHVSFEMSHSSLSRILQAQEVVGEMRYSRYLRTFKEFQKLKEVNFIYSPPDEKKAMGIFLAQEKEYVARNFMSIGRNILFSPKRLSYNKFASGMAYDIVWPHPESFNWDQFNQKISSLLVQRSEENSNHNVRLYVDEVRQIAQEVKKTPKI